MEWTRVKSRLRDDLPYEINEYGQVRRIGQTRLMVAYIKKGYWIVRMMKDGIRKMYSVHQLVADTFIPNPLFNVKRMVCHRDDDINNNHVSNLYWGDGVDNARDAVRNGRFKAVVR